MSNSTFDHDAVVFVAVPVNGVESVTGIAGDIATYLSMVIDEAERAGSTYASAWDLSPDITVYDSVDELTADIAEAGAAETAEG